eukprot:tig00000802_g4313.t1
MLASVRALFVKLESQNPGGSIKDRIALFMIESAEREGKLQPGGTIIEATAGNTGLGLALVCSRKGYKLILVVPDKMAREKIAHLKALGADVRITRSDVGKGHPEYYQDLAGRIAAETGGYYVNQFENPNNALAHECTTAPEIYSQMGGRVDAIVCGVGSGGTLTGLGRFFRRVSPSTEMVLADPKGSILAPLINEGRTVEPGSWAVEGIGEDFVPSICDLALASRAYAIPDSESFETARALLAREGILAGSSSGTLVSAALRYCREQTAPKRVLTFICDSGNKYLSKMYNEFWLLEWGFVSRPTSGVVGDVVTRRHDRGASIYVGPKDTLFTAYARMRAADVSQLPVLEGKRIMGLLDESDILKAVVRGVPPGSTLTDPFKQQVGEAMASELATLDAGEPIEAALPLFDQDRVAIVTEGRERAFVGIATRVDLINYLRLGHTVNAKLPALGPPADGLAALDLNGGGLA